MNQITERKRESPKGKRVSLFATCMVDMLYPQTGMSVVKVLEHIGVEVDFPMAQTCCGQPAFNAGYWGEARQVAEQFLKTFSQYVRISRFEAGLFEINLISSKRWDILPNALSGSIPKLFPGVAYPAASRYPNRCADRRGVRHAN